MAVVLGIHGYSFGSEEMMHDAGVCLLVDGRPVYACDEERLSRVKRDGRFPMAALEEGLEQTGLRAQDIDAVGWADWPYWRQTPHVMRYGVEALWLTGADPRPYFEWWVRDARRAGRRLPPGLRPRSSRMYEHHRCHAASAYFAGPFEDATVVTLDGMGDFSIGGSVWRASGGRMRPLWRTNGYFSPGHFYMLLTDYLGYTPGLDEGKVMGLAAAGDPLRARETMLDAIRYVPRRRDFVGPAVAEAFFAVASGRGNVVGLSARKATAQLLSGWSKHAPEDLAAAGQARFEETISAFVTDAVAAAGSPRLVVAGGCFANVALNRRMRELPSVTDVFVHPNMGDGGLSAGAALLAASDLTGDLRRPRMWETVALGPRYTGAQIDGALAGHGLSAEVASDGVERVASALASGLVVAWFAGSMEYGPRALGHRSLLADPRDAAMFEHLNARLGRSETMPFAPVVLEEHAKEWLEGWRERHHAARFMTTTYSVAPSRRGAIPAIVHLDGTVRPQVLRHGDGPALHRVLTSFHRQTGVPMAINTSFNLHGEPIVCSPRDALRTFLAGAADVLWIDGRVVVHPSCRREV